MTYDQHLLKSIVIAAAVSLGGTWWRHRRLRAWRETALRDRERAYEASYDGSESNAAILGYIEALRPALPAGAFALPEIADVPRWHGGPVAICRSALVFAADRFGQAVSPSEIAVTPHLGAGVDGMAYVSQGASTSDHATGVDDTAAFRFREGLHVQPARLAVVAAREVARVVLPRRGLRLSSDARGEALVDAAAVLVGYGPLLEQQAFQQTSFTGSQGREYVVGGQRTWLHRIAIQELRAARNTLST